MKNIPVCLITGIMLLWCDSPARADEATKSAKAEELMQLTQGDQMMKMMEPMLKGMMAQADKDMTAQQRVKVGDMQDRMLALMAVSFIKPNPPPPQPHPDPH